MIKFRDTYKTSSAPQLCRKQLINQSKASDKVQGTTVHQSINCVDGVRIKPIIMVPTPNRSCQVVAHVRKEQLPYSMNQEHNKGTVPLSLIFKLYQSINQQLANETFLHVQCAWTDSQRNAVRYLTKYTYRMCL